MIGGMKPSSSDRSPCTGSPCIGSAATIFTASPKVFFSRLPFPLNVPPPPRPPTHAHPRHERRLLVELFQDLQRRSVVVRVRVRLVAVLVGHVAGWILRCHRQSL